ncbi:hypothetical protein [Pseudoduganella chitinolytica]|uniref:Uncharacterized protein n=1 Tax=Pseudoduganella chitinolytica TaxID=34070 RepID=A0ABY8BKQ7_9BURK|nr:hypothetical protein [Pseudoduganella chitinolytica]WEF34854.1 hypothetical protein PX653_08860 [Pseudoduganella chitinolytica]
MLRASGPSTKPRSFGLSLAGGAEALQEAEQQQGAKQMQSLQARLYGVQLQDAESDLKNQEALRERAKALQEFYRSRGATPGGQAERDASGVAPAVGSREQPGGVPVAPGSGAGGGLGASLFRQRLAESQALRAAGFGQEADAAEAAALKLQPKVKELKQVQAGGKVMYAPIFEDGTPGEPIPYEAAVELARANTGGSTDLYNPITGATVRSMRNTASPDAVLSASTARRGQDMADRRAAEAQEFQRSTSKVPAGYRMLSDGSMQAIPGGPADPRAGKEGLQRTQDARDVLSLLDEALPLLKTATSSYGGPRWIRWGEW